MLVAANGDVFEYPAANVWLPKPNQFGYGPDAYRLKITAAAKPGYQTSLEAISPCFPATLPDKRSPFPTILTAD